MGTGGKSQSRKANIFSFGEIPQEHQRYFAGAEISNLL